MTLRELLNIDLSKCQLINGRAPVFDVVNKIC